MTVKHGTTHAYNFHRCRCDECRNAWNTTQARLRLIRAERPVPDNVPHGNVSTYNNYSCRCEPCRQAKVVDNRRHRERRKAQR